MSLLQRAGIYQKTEHWHSAFTPSCVSNARELTETDEAFLIVNASDASRLVSDDVLERAPPAWEVFTEYATTSFVVAIICVWLALALANVIFPAEWTLIDP